MCIVYHKRTTVLENGTVATRIAKVGRVTTASGFAPESENPLASGKEPQPVAKKPQVSHPTPVACRDSSARSGLVPTGRGHRGLIRGNTAAWR